MLQYLRLNMLKWMTQRNIHVAWWMISERGQQVHSCMLKVSITGVSKYIFGAGLGDGKTFVRRPGVDGSTAWKGMPIWAAYNYFTKFSKIWFLMIILQFIFQSRKNEEIWFTMNRLCAAMICLFSQLLVENIFSYYDNAKISLNVTEFFLC